MCIGKIYKMFYIILICAVILLVNILDRLNRDEEFEKIPGPKGTILLGNALDFLNDSVKVFYHIRTLTAKYKIFYKLKIFTKKLLIVYSPEDIEIILNGTKHTSKGFLYKFLRPWLNDGLLLSDGAKWHQRRKILTPTFYFNILRHYNSVLLEKTQIFVERLESEVGNPTTDIFPLITDFTLNSICETAMGTAIEEEEHNIGNIYKDAIHKLGTYVFYRSQKIWMYPNIIFNYSAVGRSQKKILNLVGSFRNKVIAKRKEDGNIRYLDTADSDDEYFITKKKRLAMLDLLLEAEKEGNIDSDGINEEVDTFMFAGHDTVATGLQYAFRLLANHQDVHVLSLEYIKCWIKLLKNAKKYFKGLKESLLSMAKMKYLEACIKEVLRLYPPVFFIIRKVDEPLQLGTGGYICPAGTDYTIVIFDLHRRSDQFVEPLQFRPERFLKEPTWHPYAYLPFSAGPRNCIGQKFVMMEMKLLLSKVLLEYRLLPITKPEDIIFNIDIIMRSNPVKVKIEKRNL